MQGKGDDMGKIYNMPLSHSDVPSDASSKSPM